METILQENNQIVLTLPKEFVKRLQAKVGDKLEYEMKTSVSEKEGTVELLKLKKSNANPAIKAFEELAGVLEENNAMTAAGFETEEDIVKYIRQKRNHDDLA